MAFRKNPDDKNQNELESAEFEGGFPVHVDENEHVIAPGDEQVRAGIVGNLPLGEERFGDSIGKA